MHLTVENTITINTVNIIIMKQTAFEEDQAALWSEIVTQNLQFLGQYIQGMQPAQLAGYTVYIMYVYLVKPGNT